MTVTTDSNGRWAYGDLNRVISLQDAQESDLVTLQRLEQLIVRGSPDLPYSPRVVRTGLQTLARFASGPFRPQARELTLKVFEDAYSDRDLFSAADNEELVALEAMIYVCVLFELYDPAITCTALYRRLVTHFADVVGPALLEERHSSAYLASAATTCFKRAVRDVAVTIAESGRMKYMTQVLMRPSTAPTTPWTGADVLASLEVRGIPSLLAPPHAQGCDAATAEDLAAGVRARFHAYALAHTSDVTNALLSMVSDWRSIYEPGSGVEHQDPDALTDLDLPTVQSLCGPDVAVLYFFFDSRGPGIIVISADANVSTQVSPEDIRDLSMPRISDGTWSEFATLALMSVQQELAFRKLVVIGWADVHSAHFTQAVHGLSDMSLVVTAIDPGAAQAFSQKDIEWLTNESLSPPTVLPSARLLRKDLGPVDTTRVAFYGDPTDDLVGPWVENAAWKRLRPDAVRLSSNEATVEAVRGSLQTCDLTILSCHAGVGAGGAPFIQLHDEQLSVDEVLRLGPLSPGSQVVLNCCRAAEYGEGTATEEAYGLVSALLLAGARQVLAPRLPVSDGCAAVLGSILAVESQAHRELRNAWRMVWHRLRSLSESVEHPIRIFPVAELASDSPYELSDVSRCLGVSWDDVFAAYAQYLVWGQ